MNAKEAKEIARQRVNEIQAANKSTEETLRQKKEKVFQCRVEEEIEDWKQSVKTAASYGKFDVSMSPVSNDPDEKIYDECKRRMEENGYHVTMYSTDEGYCVGNRWHIYISWN